MQLFNPLHYSKRPDMYVSAPIARIEDTYNTLENKYYNNRDAADKLEIAMANIEVNEGNEWIKDNAIAKMQQTFEAIKENGDWENASLVVRNAAKDFALDGGLNAAVKDKKNKTAQLQAAKVKVDEGKITQDDYDYEMSKAKQKYQQQNNGNGGLYQDENGTWKGQWKMRDVPEYKDRGEYINNFLDDYEPDKLLGNIIKGEDGNWYRAGNQGKLNRTNDNSHHIAYTNEKVGYKEVYEAAKTQLLQNQPMANRMRYELEKITDKSYTDYEARGINKEAMKRSLKYIGIPENELSGLNSEQLTEKYKENMIVHDSIAGSVAKYAYDRESVQVIGSTWEAQERAIRLKNAKKSGGNENTVEHFRTVQQLTTEGYIDGAIPTTVEDYENNIKEFDKAIEPHVIEMQQLLSEYEQETDENKKAILEAKMNERNTAIQEVRRNQDNYNYFYRKATNIVNKEFDLSTYKDNLNKIREADEYYNDNDLVNKVNNYAKKLLKSPEYKPYIKQTDDDNYIVDDYIISTAIIDGTLTNNEAQKYYNYAAKYEANSPELLKTNEKYINRLNEEMKKVAQETTIQYGYIDLTFKEGTQGKRSEFNHNMTHHVRTSTDNFMLIDADTGKGSTVTELKEKDELYSNFQEVEVTGITHQYVPGHGRLLVGKVPQKDDNGKVERYETVLIKPNNGKSFGHIDQAVKELSHSTMIKGSTPKAGFQTNDLSTIQRMMLNDEVDKQLAEFDKHPTLTPTQLGYGKDIRYNELTKNVNLGKYDAKITRKVSHGGDVTWDATLFTKDGNVVIDKDTRKPEQNIEFSDKLELEFALERINDTGLMVPQSMLKRTSDTTFVNGNIDEKQVEIPVMHPALIKEMHLVDSAIPSQFNIVSMTRSVPNNKSLSKDSSKTSGHLYGMGIDITTDDYGEKWFESNSSKIEGSNYRKINKTNLMYWIHGTNRHIDIKLMKTPDDIANWTGASLTKFKTN